MVRDNRKLMLNVYKSVKRDTFLIYMNDVILYIITEYFKTEINSSWRKMKSRYWSGIINAFLWEY